MSQASAQQFAIAPAPAEHVLVGERTLHMMSELEAFNRWMFESIEPYIGRRVLEAGAGIGNFTSYLADRELVVALELEADRIERLSARYASYPNVHAVAGDLTDPSIVQLASRRLDTIICLNVLEHIERDVEALTNMHNILVDGGRLLLLVPAHPWLFNSLDRGLGHFRRYREADLRAMLERVGFQIERQFFMNLAGMPGWWLNGNVLKRNILPNGPLKLYERLVPSFRWIEERIGRRFGLSVVFVAQKRRG